MEFVADVWHLFVRLGRATFRMPAYLVMSVVQPVIWVIFFGALFGAVASIPGFGATSYIQFLAPGVAVMTALFGGAYAGMGLIADIDRGVLDRMLATPVKRGALVGARIVHAGAQVVVQASLSLAVAFVRGARPHGGLGGIVAVLAAAGLLGSSLAAFSNALALSTRKQEVVLAAMNLVLLPSVYTSSTLMAQNLMPRWMAVIARVNPVNWAVVAARTGFESGATFLVVRDLALLALFAAACGGLATLTFRRYRAAM